MSTNATPCDVDIVHLDADQANEAFNQLAQRAMGITGEQFLRRWDAGEFDGVDYDDVPGLVDVWMGLPLVRATSDAGSHTH